MNTGFDPVSLALALALFALVPVIVVVATSFLKISIVLGLVRNALGVQQIPPNIAIYGLSLILTTYIMAPVGQSMYASLAKDPGATSNLTRAIQAVQQGAEPLRAFLLRNSDPRQRTFFVKTAKRLWGADMSKGVDEKNFITLVPAFMLSELTAAFEMGFLLYLPFVCIDIVVSNVLLAMGMMMVSPVMISMPLKLFLFVMADGWTRLVQGLIFTYH